LTPKKYQSGETDVTGRISKIGDGGLRTALYEAANVILTRPVKGSTLKSWGMRLAARAGMRKAKVALARKLGKTFVVSVELDPPRGADPGVVLERAQYCKEHEVDTINVADGPRASARMSAQSLCLLMQDKVGIDTILHYTCRDRNLLGIQSDLLGAYALLFGIFTLMLALRLRGMRDTPARQAARPV
jgi:hypothetical protein